MADVTQKTRRPHPWREDYPGYWATHPELEEGIQRVVAADRARDTGDQDPSPAPEPADQEDIGLLPCHGCGRMLPDEGFHRATREVGRRCRQRVCRHCRRSSDRDGRRRRAEAEGRAWKPLVSPFRAGGRRVCRGCGETLALSAFPQIRHARVTRKGTRRVAIETRSYCRGCHNAQHKAYRASVSLGPEDGGRG